MDIVNEVSRIDYMDLKCLLTKCSNNGEDKHGH